MGNKLKKVLIITYFGKLPNYFNFWLKSASFNKSFEFLIFSDDCSKFDYPSNVKFFYMTFDEMVSLIKTKIDLKIDIKPYKLCDFKPCYGDLFEKFIINYDYWGYCDLDLVFGNLEKFYNDDLLLKYDKISDAGHFTLFKNTSILRTAYRNLTSKDCYIFDDVISSIKNFAFDEWGRDKGLNRILLNNGFKLFYHPIIFADICTNTYGLISTRINYGPEKDIIEERKKHNICYSFNNGELFQHYLDENGQINFHEESYVHLQKRPLKIENSDTSMFILYPPNKIIEYCLIDSEFLSRINERRIYLHYFKLRLNSLKTKIRRIFC